ncbi:YqeG family HAD IIIA-type phosphatase [Paenibacillus thiaminolyticus]|uniref:YqeG family HAD IIIA-type phosphatase n=1 Tax=Paenibacillus thiaminolyticus TaxID=49283 RepID=A0ABT4FUI5_PANTH|nr:YqeG family HAD IIIA-type phosphatase [Paenibacillus thiaminolyticus]MCY9537677.1 YqeG family HAD IIIA-type phosphatase [Paenibacillus thiaminolyticus]MCY9601758.1 YqeG family HAD IIIA-type phosphatase [Paenibacillus thiaminolyticus]MCY9607110.1 YqeG family HAD IIIA-type phosphatase [Paenibacillus thiaminolyticus]MCY9614202.1 YqeG family HAD IIIA-type phosphatase [Paenibacillus thiaminolyticus]MCY9619241.1 YqeG family HAD IIIA-type phosphatase [Paenibacillus thiaminolyticus]
MLERLIPRLRVSSVYDIDLDKLAEQGIRGIITDLDNTLVGAKVPEATPELAAWLKEVDRRGFKVVIVSNNDHTRVSRFAVPLDLPFIHAARKPAQRAFRQALSLMGLKPDQTAVIGDQMLTDVLGGNRLGIFTILVQPIAIQDEGWGTRINRRIERYATARLKRRGLWHEEEKR